jgi:hypothetical protein
MLCAAVGCRHSQVLFVVVGGNEETIETGDQQDSESALGLAQSPIYRITVWSLKKKIVFIAYVSALRI